MKKTQYFVDKDGNYIGGFEGAKPPRGAIEVPEAPDHAKDTWKDGEWVKHEPEGIIRLDSDIEAVLDVMAPSDIAKLPQDLKDRYAKRKAEKR